jgi:hypothetical protein
MASRRNRYSMSKGTKSIQEKSQFYIQDSQKKKKKEK